MNFWDNSLLQFFMDVFQSHFLPRGERAESVFKHPHRRRITVLELPSAHRRMNRSTVAFSIEDDDVQSLTSIVGGYPKIINPTRRHHKRQAPPKFFWIDIHYKLRQHFHFTLLHCCSHAISLLFGHYLRKNKSRPFYTERNGSVHNTTTKKSVKAKSGLFVIPKIAPIFPKPTVPF